MASIVKAEIPKVETWQSEIVERLDKASEPYLLLGPAIVYAVKSESDPMAVHYVVDFENGARVCTDCRGFRYRGTCGHLKKYAEWLDNA